MGMDPKDDMSMTWSDLDETALGWATGQCILPRRQQKPALFDLFCTRFGKTSRKAARAVRDFVTCSSPQSNGFMEDVTTTTTTTTTTSQESPIDLQTSPDETPSTIDASNHMQPPRAVDKPARDVWLVRNGISPPARHRDSKTKARHNPSHCHWKTTHGQAGANADTCYHRACGAEVTSTSTCGPKLPTNFFDLPTKQRLRTVKHFLAGFVCKPNSETSLQANKQRPLCRLMATARMIVYKPEPIKSVEAIFLALYLTAGLLSVERTPLCFKTKFADEVSQHIVVLVQHNGKYGAFGISPNPDLMTKDFQFDSMSSIVESYLKAYKAIAHTVLKIRIGLPVEHDVVSTHFICWRHLCLSPDVKSWAECVVEIENHVLRMRRLWDLWVLTGKGDDPRKARMARRKALDNTSFIAPRAGKPTSEKQPPVAVTIAAPPEVVEKPVKSKPLQQAPAAPQPRQRKWDAESTGSNNTTTEDCAHCEHCEQLKREAPPSDTKRASVTTMSKRIKTSVVAPHKSAESFFFESNTTVGALLATAADQLVGSHGSHGFHSKVHFQSRSLNHMSLAATKQILKNFVHSSVLSTPPRRFARRSHGAARDSLLRKAHPKFQPGESTTRRRKMHPGGPLYNLTLAQTKSKAG